MRFIHGLTVVENRVSRCLLALVVAAYGLAAVWPTPGLRVKQCVLAEVGATAVTVPMALLAMLLFNAGMGTSAGVAAAVARRPAVVLAGVAVNVLTPLGFLVALRLVLSAWHDLQEANDLLLGLAVVAAMPVAGSSTAWAQNAGGNVALSLALVLVSTFLSPLTTPLVLAGVGAMADGDALASGQGTSAFLIAVVVVPSTLGLLLRGMAGATILGRVKPALKLVNAVVLLVLCYANATVALPQVVADPDWDYLLLVALAVSGLCVTAFGSGWLLATGLRTGAADRQALMFGLGMSNNGTGLVLAASAFASLPGAVIPVLAYNLVQHVVAGGVCRWASLTEESRTE